MRIIAAAVALALIAAPLAACNKVGPGGAPSPEKTLKDGQAFLKNNARQPGVKTLPKGIQYKVIRSAPEGARKPGLTDEVKVHYEGRFIDGTVFDSSFDSGVPAVFRLDRVIPGWTEALQQMHIGDEWEIYIPSEMAYGAHPEEHGANPAEMPPNSVLIFKVQLLDSLPSLDFAPAMPGMPGIVLGQ